MKRLLTFLTFALTFSTNAQTVLDKLYIDLNAGTRLLGKTSEATKVIPGIHFDAGVGYQLNPNIAIKGEFAVDSYKAQDSVAKWDGQMKIANINDESVLYRATVNAVINVGELAGFATENFGFKVQVGAGVASNSNTNYKNSTSGIFSDPGIKGNDDMITGSLGLNPQYRISDRVALNGTVSFAILAKQSHYIDRSINNALINGTDQLMNASIGISVKLGK